MDPLEAFLASKRPAPVAPATPEPPSPVQKAANVEGVGTVLTADTAVLEDGRMRLVATVPASSAVQTTRIPTDQQKAAVGPQPEFMTPERTGAVGSQQAAIAAAGELMKAAAHAANAPAINPPEHGTAFTAAPEAPTVAETPKARRGRPPGGAKTTTETDPLTVEMGRIATALEKLVDALAASKKVA